MKDFKVKIQQLDKSGRWTTITIQADNSFDAYLKAMQLPKVIDAFVIND